MALREVVVLAVCVVFILQFLTVAASNYGQSQSTSGSKRSMKQIKSPGGGNTGGYETKQRTGQKPSAKDNVSSASNSGTSSASNSGTSLSGHSGISSSSASSEGVSMGQGGKRQVSPVKKKHRREGNRSTSDLVSKDGDQALTKAGSRGSYSESGQISSSTTSHASSTPDSPVAAVDGRPSRHGRTARHQARNGRGRQARTVPRPPKRGGRPRNRHAGGSSPSTGDSLSQTSATSKASILSSPNSRSTASTGRELISSNGAENVRDYADGSKGGLNCLIHTLHHCGVYFRNIPQEVQDLSVSERDIAGHVDVENRRIQLFVKKNGAAPHSLTCQNIDWREFDQYCDVKTGDIKSPRPDIESKRVWFMAIGKLFDSNRKPHSTASTGRELISSNGAENVGDYADGSKGIECKLYATNEIGCGVSFNGIPQEVQDLSVRQTEIRGHVDVENKRIQLFVKKNGAAPHCLTCQNIDWTLFEQYCDVKTGNIESLPDITSDRKWWMTIGKLFDAYLVGCDLYRIDGMCVTNFYRPLSPSSKGFTHVDVEEGVIRSLVKTAEGAHADECNAESYAMFDLACYLETFGKGPYGQIAKQRVTKWEVVRDGEECKAHVKLHTQQLPHGVLAKVSSTAIRLFVEPIEGSRQVKFTCEDIPEECRLENPEPKVESGFVEGTAVPTVRWSMTLGTWAIQKNCELVINPDTGVCTAHIQFDKSLKPKAVSGSVVAKKGKELIKWSAKTAGSEASDVLYICEYPANHQCGLQHQPPAKLTFVQLPKGHVSYSMIVGMVAPRHKLVKDEEIDCSLVTDNLTNCQVDMKLVLERMSDGSVSYSFKREGQDKKVTVASSGDKPLRGSLGREISVFVQPTFAFVCRHSDLKWVSPVGDVIPLVSRECEIEPSVNSRVDLIEEDGYILYRITVGKRKKGHSHRA